MNIKRFVDEKENHKVKKKELEDFTLLAVPKDSILLLQHYFTLFGPYLYFIYTLWPWGRKLNNITTERGRKSKTRGGEKSKAAQLYTPLAEEEKQQVNGNNVASLGTF